jgi:folylpolyglutamate synthase/dihydropteroate synthase
VDLHHFLFEQWIPWNQSLSWLNGSAFQEKTQDDIPMPAYFRFLALLAFKIFSDEQVNPLQILSG